MGRKAKPENCEHPAKALTTQPSFGHTMCARCDTDLTPSVRHFEWKHSERITLSQGERVVIRGDGPGRPAFQGRFEWAEEFPSGMAYMISELQTYKVDKTHYEGVAALRFIRPEFVKRAPGLRDRQAREESE